VDEDLRTESSSLESVDEYREFVVFKRGLIRWLLGGINRECEDRVRWNCRGHAREGDIFVALEPESWNVLLRKCRRPGDVFEIVAWGDEMESPLLSRYSSSPVKDKTAYYLADAKRYDKDRAKDPP
jgi:hypothetical protein